MHDAATGEPLGGRPEEDLSRCRGLLQPGGGVEREPRGECGVRLVGENLARLDPDPHLEIERLDRRHDGERGADGALRVVLVREGDAEDGHDRVTGELLDRCRRGAVMHSAT